MDECDLGSLLDSSERSSGSLLQKLQQIVEWILLSNPLNVVVIPVAGVALSTTPFLFHSVFYKYAWIRHSVYKRLRQQRRFVSSLLCGGYQ